MRWPPPRKSNDEPEGTRVRNYDASFTYYVPIRAGQADQAAFEAWWNVVSESPPCCRYHGHGPLRPIKEPWYVRDDEFGKTQLRVTVEFRCPSCTAQRADCPDEFYTTTLDSYPGDTPERVAAVARCRDYVQHVQTHGQGFLLLVGPVGVGKTGLACSILKELYLLTGCYARFGELTRIIRERYGRKEVVIRRSLDASETEDGEPDLLRHLCGVGLLLLDELGSGPLASDEKPFLDELIKTRFDRGRRPTVLLTNLPLAASGPPGNQLPGFKEFVGDALSDRICHAAGDGHFVVQIHGRSLRELERKRRLDEVVARVRAIAEKSAPA